MTPMVAAPQTPARGAADVARAFDQVGLQLGGSDFAGVSKAYPAYPTGCGPARMRTNQSSGTRI
jgi:hypothetical protein